jgi:hypothetical protein
MQARILTAARGNAWLTEGYRLFRTNPALLTAIAMAYFLVALLLNVVPLVGPLVLSLVMPSLTVVAANGVRLLREQRPLTRDTLATGLQRNVPGLLRLGLVQLAGSLTVLTLTVLFTGNPAANLEGEEATLVRGLLVLVPLLLPLVLLLWFAPYLAAWHDLPAGKALFFGVIGVLRNWKPFLVYGLSVALWAMVAPGGLLILAGSLFPGALDLLSTLVRMLVLFVVGPVLVASVYFSYLDVFGGEIGDKTPLAGPPEPPDDA